MISSQEIAAALLKQAGYELHACRELQQLWAGYGHICQLEAIPSHASSADASEQCHFILKCIVPPSLPGSGVPDEGHIRKVLSYQIEQFFYTKLAPRMPKDIGIASCLSSISAPSSAETGATAMILTDLKVDYPVSGGRRGQLSQIQARTALTWLARFHGFWWTQVCTIDKQNLCLPPLEHLARHETTSLVNHGIWLNGGYTYLATRRSEYTTLASDTASEWSTKLCTPFSYSIPSSVAELVASVLSPSATSYSPIHDFQTLSHGDVKSENFFTTASGSSAAFFDFQYVGLGLGVTDLAKLFTCSIPLSALIDTNMMRRSNGEFIPMQLGEEGLLRQYLITLEERSGKDYPWDIFLRHWETALVDWLRFQASWGFWGNTEWLEGRVRHILQDQDGWVTWLRTQI